jgi:hypothetical protein
VLVGGFRAVEPMIGRVGGLFRPLIVELRGPVEGGVSFVEDVVEVVGRLEVVRGRLGGTPFWRGGVVFSLPESAACSPPDVTAGAGPSVGGTGTETPSSVLSMMRDVWMLLIGGKG